MWMNRARDGTGWETEFLAPRPSLHFVVNQQNRNIRQAEVDRCLQDPFIPSKDKGIIVFQSELARLSFSILLS
jgi:hypothetical protein